MTTGTILTDGQIEQGRQDTFSTDNPFCPCDSKTMRKAVRWAEKAILQSPEIQALRKDAERYRWLRDNSSVILDRHAWFKSESGTHIETTMPLQRELDAAIDAAKEQ